MYNHRSVGSRVGVPCLPPIHLHEGIDCRSITQYRGALFALDESHLNWFEPLKRPFHTIIPAVIAKDGKPYFCFGVMGGDMQPQGHVQVIMNLIDF